MTTETLTTAASIAKELREGLANTTPGPWRTAFGWPAQQSGWVIAALFDEEPDMPVISEAAAFVVSDESCPDESLPAVASHIARCSPNRIATLIEAFEAMGEALRIARLHADLIRLAPERRHTIAVLDAALAKAGL